MPSAVVSYQASEEDGERFPLSVLVARYPTTTASSKSLDAVRFSREKYRTKAKVAEILAPILFFLRGFQACEEIWRKTFYPGKTIFVARDL